MRGRIRKRFDVIEYFMYVVVVKGTQVIFLILMYVCSKLEASKLRAYISG